MLRSRLFTFDTTHHALWAEETALGSGIPAELVPAPPAAPKVSGKVARA